MSNGGGVCGKGGGAKAGACMARGCACVGGGMHVWGPWQGGGEMATAVDGMHPTGMHSCINI